MTSLQFAAVVVAATLFIIGLIVLLVVFIRRSQALTTELEQTEKEFQAERIHLKGEKSKLEIELTKSNAERDAVRSRHETDTLTFGRELRAAQDERDEYKKRMHDHFNLLQKEQERTSDLRAELRAVTCKNEELLNKVNALLAMLSNTGEAVEQATAILTKEFDTRGWNRGKDGRFVTVDEQGSYSAPTPVKQLSEVVAQMGERPDDSHAGEQIQTTTATFSNGGQVPAHGNEKKADELFDPTKYKAFPRGYKVKEGEEIEAVVLTEQLHIEYGAKGKIVGDGTHLPHFEEPGKRRRYIYIHDTAPLNPEQHPEHPNFKPAE